MIEIWGIPTCGTTRKAIKFLEGRNVPFVFKNYRATRPARSLLEQALRTVDAPRKLFNTSGAAYREGGFGSRAATMSGPEVLAALLENPMLIKRPIVRTEKGIAVGFDEGKISALIP